MKLLLDFPTIGEPHYANAVPASLIQAQQVKFYKLTENTHPFATKADLQGIPRTVIGKKSGSDR